MVYWYTHGGIHFAAEPDADGGISRGMKEKSGPVLNRPKNVLSRFMPVNQKLRQHKKGALREKNRRKNNKNSTWACALSLSFRWCWGPGVHAATRWRGGAGVGSVTIERARMKTTERKIGKDPPQNNKMAGSWAGVGEPLPCLTPSVSEQACMIRGEMEGGGWERREEQKLG